MRCHNAKKLLTPQLEEHLRHCPTCRVLEQQQCRLDTLLRLPISRSGVSTHQIMLAVQQQGQIMQQLEDIRKRQQSRIARWRNGAVAWAALAFFTLSSIPLLVLAIAIVQTDLVMKAFFFLRSTFDVVYVFAQGIQVGLTLITQNNWLLSGVAFVVVMMMVMWLCLMRTQDA